MPVVGRLNDRFPITATGRVLSGKSSRMPYTARPIKKPNSIDGTRLSSRRAANTAKSAEKPIKSADELTSENL